VISIDSKEGVVAVLITTFLDRQLSKVCNLVKREIVTLMGVLPRVFPFQAQIRWKGSHERLHYNQATVRIDSLLYDMLL
jgi:hypothetical protein